MENEYIKNHYPIDVIERGAAAVDLLARFYCLVDMYDKETISYMFHKISQPSFFDDEHPKETAFKNATLELLDFHFYCDDNKKLPNE